MAISENSSCAQLEMDGLGQTNLPLSSNVESAPAKFVQLLRATLPPGQVSDFAKRAAHLFQAKRASDIFTWYSCVHG